METDTTTKNIRLLFISMLLAISTASIAAEYDASIRAGYGITDNIARTAQNMVEETITTVGFDYSVTNQTNRMDLDLLAQVDYVDYKDQTFDSEWIGGLNLRADFTLIDEYLQWTFQNNLGQALFNPLQPATPNNRENINFFTTGPTLDLLAGGRGNIDIELRYSRMNYEVRPNDNERYSARLGIGRDVSRASNLSIVASAERVEFDDEGLRPPIELREAFVRFESDGNRSTFGLDLGYNEVEYEGETGDGHLARLDYTRQTSANGSFSVSGGSQYSDQGDVFRFFRDITNDLRDTTDGTPSPAPFRNNFFVVSYAIDQERYSVLASVDFNQEDFEDDQLIDRDLYRANLQLRRELTRTVFAGVRASFQRREFTDLATRDDDLILGVNIGYRFTPGFNMSLDYQRFERDSTTPGGNFTEDRAFLRASYTPVWSR